MEEKPVVSEPLRECKFVVHIPKYEDRPDMHYIKEKIVYPDGRVEDVNPSTNITSGKEEIYRLFDLNDNFMLLSQISANKKGIGGLRHADRKRYVNAIISSVDAYNDMHKLFSQKSTVVKSMINGIMDKKILKSTELDDTFVNQNFGFNTVAEFKDDVKKYLLEKNIKARKAFKEDHRNMLVTGQHCF